MEELHELSFCTWLGLVSIHLLAYVWRVPRLMLAALQRIAVVGGGLTGIAMALALLPIIRAWIRG